MEHVDANGIEPNAPQPIPRRTTARVRRIGAVRLPIAGPYRPWARLYLFPDGRTVWVVRLWEFDRAVPHVLGTPTLRTFARQNRLTALEREIDRLAAAARAEARRAGW